MMAIPRLKESLCGCTVRTGTLILAWFSIIVNSLQLLNLASTSELYFQKTDPEEGGKEILDIKTKFALITATIIVSLGLNIMVLLGIYKRNHCLIMPWVIMFGCACALDLLLSGIYLLAALFDTKYLRDVLIHSISTGVGVYFFLIIHSFYQEVKEERQINNSSFKPEDA